MGKVVIYLAYEGDHYGLSEDGQLYSNPAAYGDETCHICGRNLDRLEENWTDCDYAYQQYGKYRDTCESCVDVRVDRTEYNRIAKANGRYELVKSGIDPSLSISFSEGGDCDTMDVIVNESYYESDDIMAQLGRQLIDQYVGWCRKYGDPMQGGSTAYASAVIARIQNYLVMMVEESDNG